jgi:hypothetical protein
MYFSQMKVSEEYTYKNSLSEKPVTIILSDYALTIQTGGKEKTIPYASIISIRLCKSKNKYESIITPDGHDPIVVTNHYYLSNREREDRSRQYATFVRVLHFHLRDKSTAEYICGFYFINLLIWACLSVVVAFLVSFTLDFFHASPINSNLLAIALSLIFIAFLVSANWGHFPNIYTPENIPMQFLP